MIKEDLKIDCVITSPPYWALRDYGIEPNIWDGDTNCEHDFEIKEKEITLTTSKNSQCERPWRKEASGKYKEGFCFKCGAWKGNLGLEPNFELFIKHLCDIYDLIWKVLKPSGTCWVNIADTYGGSGNSSGHNKNTKNFTRKTSEYGASKGNQKFTKKYQKCLLMIPQRFAIEMINRGWILRNTIIWNKPNPMPSSAKNRFSVDFEYLYFFVKTNKIQYWINEKTGKLISTKPLGIKGIEGIDWEWRKCEKCSGTGIRHKKCKACEEEGWIYNILLQPEKCSYCKGLGRIRQDKECKSCKGKGIKKYNFWRGRQYFFNQQFEPISDKKATRERYKYAPATNSNFKNTGDQSKPTKAFSKHWVSMRNKRTIWTIPTKPCSEAHFAVFPDTLVKTPIKAGCPRFICKECGKPRLKLYQETEEYLKLKQKWKGVNLNGNISIGRNRKTGYPGHISREVKFAGYSDCGCNEGFRPGIVLDPFAGIGTALLTAWRLGRNFIGFEISKEYYKIAKRRLVVANTKRLDEFTTSKNKKKYMEV